MSRLPRIAPGGCVFHVLNRANAFDKLFHSPAEYDEFARLLARCRETDDMRILAWCLMPNHWHLLLWPKKDEDVIRFVTRLTIRHTKHQHIRDDTTGRGHLYQGRYKSSPVQDDRHLLTVCRYIERNPVRARLVARATEWRWSSAREHVAIFGGRAATEKPFPLEPMPAECPADWARWLRDPDEAAVVDRIRSSVAAGGPFGTDHWAAEACRVFGFPESVKPKGRPRKNCGDAAVVPRTLDLFEKGS